MSYTAFGTTFAIKMAEIVPKTLNNNKKIIQLWEKLLESI